MIDRRPQMGRVLATFTLLCAVFLSPVGADRAEAQEAPAGSCAYEECALRVKRGFFGSSLVRGSQEEKVAGLDFWVGNLDSVFEGSPVAQDLAGTFRARHNTGTVMALLGAAAMVVGLASQSDWLHGSDPPTTFWVGMVVASVGGIVSETGWDPLSRAVWEFNRATGR
jgi:hypothetical protein